MALLPNRALGPILGAALAVTLAGCGEGGSAGSSGSSSESASTASTAGQDAAGQRFPDIVAIEISPAGDRNYDLAVTVSSAYDTPDRYADGWRVLAPDGTVLGEHTLLHDHAAEQPFTRTQTGVAIPADVDQVTVEGRDLENGYGGGTVTADVPSG